MSCERPLQRAEHTLPRATRRRARSQTTHVCRGCGEAFYVHTEYSQAGAFRYWRKVSDLRMNR